MQRSEKGFCSSKRRRLRAATWTRRSRALQQRYGAYACAVESQPDSRLMLGCLHGKAGLSRAGPARAAAGLPHRPAAPPRLATLLVSEGCAKASPCRHPGCIASPSRSMALCASDALSRTRRRRTSRQCPGAPRYPFPSSRTRRSSRSSHAAAAAEAGSAPPSHCSAQLAQRERFQCHSTSACSKELHACPVNDLIAAQMNLSES